MGVNAVYSAPCGADRLDRSLTRIRTCQRHRNGPLGGSIPRCGGRCAHRHIFYKGVFSGAPKKVPTRVQFSRVMNRTLLETQNAPAVGVCCDRTLVTRSPLLRRPRRFTNRSALTIARARFFTPIRSTSRKLWRSKNTAKRLVLSVCRLAPSQLYVFSYVQRLSVSARSSRTTSSRCRVNARKRVGRST